MPSIYELIDLRNDEEPSADRARIEPASIPNQLTHLGCGRHEFRKDEKGYIRCMTPGCATVVRPGQILFAALNEWYEERMRDQEAPICPDHQVPMALRNSRFGQFYGCPRWPACEIKIGCHPGTTKPLGIPVDGETRQARIRAHDAFDVLWRGDSARMTRKEAYRWLADELEIDPSDCHIGRFGSETCDRVVDLVEAFNGQ